jgi:DNA-binding ferritin-like protein (Dps family)
MTAVEWLFIELYEKFEMKGDGREMNKVLEQAKAMEKEYKANIRRAIADYMYSEGCACCEGKDHKDHAEKIAKLIDVPKYEDGSDYNFSQFRSN